MNYEPNKVLFTHVNVNYFVYVKIVSFFHQILHVYCSQDPSCNVIMHHISTPFVNVTLTTVSYN